MLGPTQTPLKHISVSIFPLLQATQIILGCGYGRYDLNLDRNKQVINSVVNIYSDPLKQIHVCRSSLQTIQIMFGLDVRFEHSLHKNNQLNN